MYNRINTVLIDYQFVSGKGNTKHIKELAILPLHQLQAGQYLFKPPYSERELNYVAHCTNGFAVRNIHGITWREGNVDYLNLEGILKDAARSTEFGQWKTIIVASSSKQQFLEQYLPECSIVVLKGLRSFNQIYQFQHYCNYHDKNFTNCSLHHVHKMNVYMERKKMLRDKVETVTWSTDEETVIDTDEDSVAVCVGSADDADACADGADDADGAGAGAGTGTGAVCGGGGRKKMKTI